MERLNLSELDGVTKEALRKGQIGLASELIGKHLRKIQGPLPGKPQTVTQTRLPENMKKHITRAGK